MFLLRELIPKYIRVRFEFLMNVIVAIFSMNVSKILMGTDSGTGSAVPLPVTGVRYNSLL